jgi:hypothetical protein
MESAKNVTPILIIPQAREDGDMESPTVGRSNTPCARRDNTPAVSRRVFLYESRDMMFKRIAQKRFFFYRAPVIYKTSGLLLGYFQL